MSTHYYGFCRKHRAVSDVIGGRSFPDRWWENDEGQLASFLEAHGDCQPLILSEHDSRVENALDGT